MIDSLWRQVNYAIHLTDLTCYPSDSSRCPPIEVWVKKLMLEVEVVALCRMNVTESPSLELYIYVYRLLCERRRTSTLEICDCGGGIVGVNNVGFLSTFPPNRTCRSRNCRS